ncbi:2-hydroxyacyl-CoA dehydratase [bacterium]|nr:2-hydroxyacyl-CoA dehydratase [bacterium]
MTTTIPSEVIWAAGCVPVDLNNIFITSDRRDDYIKKAERDGYPRNVCAWIKGIYGVLSELPDITTVVAVTQGDCSNTHALMETLQLKGIRTIPFAFPYNRDFDALAREIAMLAKELGTTVGAAEAIRGTLEPVRKRLDELDRMTWEGNRITGAENHLWLVSSSDFNSDYERFSSELGILLDTASKRTPFGESVRLGYIGVPPIIDDLYDAAEAYGARFVINEIQRQFSMPERGGGLVDQYLAYTYPYDVFHRLDYINRELARRSVHGIVHYVQSFCHRHIEDIVIRKKVKVPVLTIEGEAPGNVDERTKIRLQAFIEMLGRRVKKGMMH